MPSLKPGNILSQIFTGANIISVIVMILVGFSYLADPREMSLWAVSGLTFPVLIVINLLFIPLWVVFDFKRLIIPVLGFVICYSPIRTYIPINSTKSDVEANFKVITYNTLNFSSTHLDPRYHDAPGIIKFLCEESADIVCVQEAPITYLAQERLDSLKSVYPYYRQDEHPHQGNHIGILSKYPIIHADSIRYESLANLTMFYEIALPNDTLLVVNCHLETNKFSPEEKEQFHSMVKGKMQKQEMQSESRSVVHKLSVALNKRAPQADAIAEFLAENSNRTVIVCGDFNDSPISYCRYRVGWDLTDCYRERGLGPGWTFNASGMHLRIDNIFCSKDITPVTCKVHSEIKASDHYPVVCTMKIPLK